MAAAADLRLLHLSAGPSSPAGGAAKRARPLRDSDTADGESQWVLVVDPDERRRSVLSAGLLREGFGVVQAGSALEAQRQVFCARPAPGLIVCENELPDEDGFSLCGQLRADARTADVPVILLSRADEPCAQELAAGAGVDVWLPRPVYQADVVAHALLLCGCGSSTGRYEAHSGRLPLHKALRALLTDVRAGRLEVSQGQGLIVFRGGEVVDARYEALRGEDALEALLREDVGPYEVAFGPSLSRATFCLDLATYCRRTLPRLEAWQSLRTRGTPLASKLVVDFARLPPAVAALPEEVRAHLRWFDGTRTLADALRAAVVADPDADDLTLWEAASALHSQGVLVGAVRRTGPVSELDDALQKQLDVLRIQPGHA